MCKYALPLRVSPDLGDVARFLAALHYESECLFVDPRIALTSPCICWLRGTDDDGYGTIKVKGHKVRTHRLSYALFNGPLVPGMQVHHLCFNRRCVNPDHLKLLTHWENAAIKAQHEREQAELFARELPF